MSDLVCEHGSLRRKCELCERDERIKELGEELTAIKHEAWRLVQVLNAYDGSGIPRSDASDAFVFLRKIGVERVLRGEGGEDETSQ